MSSDTTRSSTLREANTLEYHRPEERVRVLENKLKAYKKYIAKPGRGSKNQLLEMEASC